MKLNPLARSFEPGFQYFQQHDAEAVASAASEDSDWHIDVLELPREVICHILGQVKDVEGQLSCALASRQLCSLLASTALNINLSSHFSARDRQAQSRIPAALEGLGKYTPDLRQLDLDGLSVENWDVDRVVSQFQHLRVLSCSSCNRLTPDIVNSFTSWEPDCLSHFPSLQLNGSDSDDDVSPSMPRSSARLCLEALSLQRCFQLNSSVLTALLNASKSINFPLTTLALSHLDLTDWVYDDPYSSGLEACGARLSSDSTLDLPSIPSLSQSACSGGSLSGLQASGLRVLVLNKCTNLSADGLLSIAEGCPKLQMLFLGGSQLPSVMDLGSTAELRGPEHLLERVAALMRDLVPISAVSEHSWKTTELSYPLVEAQASCLAVMVLAAPELCVLELTFIPHSVLELLGQLLQALFKGSWRLAPQLWNFFQASSIASALRTLKSVTGTPGCSWKEPPEEVPQCVGSPYAGTGAAATALALKCAANCSTATRWTPLHFAALGDADAVANLIALGANVNARHHGGATPLFLACESGKDSRIADLLLQAGANGQMNNAAGESPLYISALRGHANMVKALLHHFKAHAVEWRSPSLYSDGWTPLMAACVADRCDVALLLLLAAGTHAAVMVSDKNKYGQNVFHIAARKGSLRLLKLLLSTASSTGAVAAHDVAGETPMDVARKNRHSIAETEFNRVCVY